MLEVGDKIKIIFMDGEPQYTNREGIVESINKDPWGLTAVRGTWGGCSLYLEKDLYKIIEKVKIGQN